MNTYSDFLHIEFDDNNILSSLFGIDDANLRMIEKFNKVKIDYRGNQVKIAGNKVSIEKTKKTLLNLSHYYLLHFLINRGRTHLVLVNQIDSFF